MAAITKTRYATRSSVTGGGVWWRSESNICGGFGRPKSFRGRRKLVRSQRLPAVAACAKLPPNAKPPPSERGLWHQLGCRPVGGIETVTGGLWLHISPNFPRNVNG